MADDTSTTTEPVSGEVEQQDEASKPADTVPPEIKAALRKANKEAESLRLKLKEFEDRDKTEAQRLAERAEQAERELTALRVESLRSRIALAKGVPADLVDLLSGTTEEELNDQADRLLARIPAAAATSRPAGDVDQGVRTTPLALNGDPLLDSLKNKLGIR